MRRPARCAAWSLIVGIALVMCLLLCASGAFAGGSPRNVLVVENSLSNVSKDIADYYMAARGIPPSNRCRIRCSTSEIVSRAECETNILAPILRFIQESGVGEHIDYIVLTKGVPLGANYGYSSGALSICSILTCLSEPSVDVYITNPYGPLASNRAEVAFSHQLNLGGYHIYLVTRLDGYTVQDIHRMIDGSVAPSPLGPVLIDLKALDGPGSTVMLNQRLSDANSLLVSKGIPTIFDDTSTFLGGKTGLMGYFSWGSNDPSFTAAAYTSNRFVPGSIADSFVSTSARTFYPASSGQSLIADMIAQGACGANGNVSEPYVAYANYPDVLFDRYTKGFNLAESFFAACPMLFWKAVVIGDPLMAPYSTPPQVAITAPQHSLTGLATLSATAWDASGIARVDFYVDGKLVGSCAHCPYSVPVDTTAYFVGQHSVDVMALEAAPAGSQSWASTMVSIENPVSVLKVIADAFPCKDEQGVQCHDKVVTAGTSEMGGSEFYVQEANGVSGIRVVSSTVVAEGDVVSISGELITDSGERSILADEVVVDRQLLTPLEPIRIPTRWIGGGDFCANTKGMTGGRGLRNTGLLVTTWGKIAYVGGDKEDFFYIDDGSRLRDGSGHVGVKVKCNGMGKPAVGTYAVVTGISSCEDMSGRIVPILKMRRKTDLSDAP